MKLKKNKVLIADDEELICVLLQKIIQWEELNLELAGVVNNGADLFEAINEKHPDIVITDICMPGMDGIELIKKVRYEQIPCKFIIVSGYRQFEYAHNALKYNVDDYILKPIDNKEINDALRKLVQSIDPTEPNIADNDINGRVQKVSAEKMKRFFLNRIIHELKDSESSIEAIEREYGIEFKDGYFQCLHIKLDIIEKTQEFGDDSNSIQNKLILVFKEIFNDCCYQVLVDLSFGSILIGINYAETQENNIHNCIKKYFEYAKNIIDLFIGFKITIGVGKPYKNIWDFKKSESEANEAINCRIVEGIDRVIYWGRLNLPAGIINESRRKQILERLAKDFEILDVEDFEKCIKELFVLVINRFSPVEMYNLLEQIQELFFEREADLIQEFYNENYLRKQIHFALTNAISIKDLENAIREPIVQAMKKFLEDVKKRNAKPIRLAISYIEDNYAKQIKLEDIAGEVNLNPVYFSNIFKKEIGVNFIDYLTSYRIKKAKELLSSSSKNVNEVAFSVGYTDPRYFSKTFKKIVGIKPMEYRKIYG